MPEIKTIAVERYEVDGQMFDTLEEAHRHIASTTLTELVTRYAAVKGYTKKNSVTRITNELLSWEAWKASQ